ncbi:hypothetical protein HZH68_008777 [Vespula germanica]|uniref:Uncharacterized protein n=1 Tax=Vespula germanica TaxID=30212 RepID=A0A834K0I1_VESGE|nr:hypothetical protein HZH68_008777 [Vespula germanica]
MLHLACLGIARKSTGFVFSGTTALPSSSLATAATLNTRIEFSEYSGKVKDRLLCLVVNDSHNRSSSSIVT